jgi:hypothetical protein
MRYFTLIASVFLVAKSVTAQEDLLSLVEEKKDTKPEKVYATFKTYRLGNAQTTETVKAKHLDFRICHRFGNIYDDNIPNSINQTFQTFFGFDNSQDIRFSFDYGITNRLTLGIGRGSNNSLLDGSVKFRILEQTNTFSMPISLAYFGDVGYTHKTVNKLYDGVVKDFSTNELHRFNFVNQLIIASKITPWLSAEILPTYIHRNYVKQRINKNDLSEDPNGLFSCGIGARVKLTKRMCLIGDYFYNFSPFYVNNDVAHNPLSFGVELETGGHVFSLFFTNAGGLIENNYLVNTSDSWTKGQVKFGFSISRVFAL